MQLTPNEIYYQTGKDTILHQGALHREFSDRAVNLLNLGVATLVAGAVVINFRIEDIEWTNLLSSLGALALLAFLSVAVLCLSVLGTGDWHSFPYWVKNLSGWKGFWRSMALRFSKTLDPSGEITPTCSQS